MCNANDIYTRRAIEHNNAIIRGEMKTCPLCNTGIFLYREGSTVRCRNPECLERQLAEEKAKVAVFEAAKMGSSTLVTYLEMANKRIIELNRLLAEAQAELSGLVPQVHTDWETIRELRNQLNASRRAYTEEQAEIAALKAPVSRHRFP